MEDDGVGGSAEKTESGSTKAATWLTIALGITGLMAFFFGITNFDQLKHWVDHQPAQTTNSPVAYDPPSSPNPSPSPTSPNVAACKLANEALAQEVHDAQPDTTSIIATTQAYDDALQNAADSTTDPVMQSDLRNAAYDGSMLIQSEQDGDVGAQTAWTGEIGSANEAWNNYCASSGGY